MKQYFYSDGQNNFGPFTIEELQNKGISKDTMVWEKENDRWMRADSIIQFKSTNGQSFQSPPPFKRGTEINQNNYTSKKKSGKWIIPVIISIFTVTAVAVLVYILVFENMDSKYHQNDAKTVDQVVSDCYVSASSSMKASGFLTFDSRNVIDENLKTWWTPAYPNNSGYNSWIQLNFLQEKNICGVEIHGGSHYPDYPTYGDIFLQNNRLTEFVLVFSDGQQENISIPELDEIQTFKFKEHKTTYVKLLPINWSAGSRWYDLCISHFMAIESIELQDDN